MKGFVRGFKPALSDMDWLDWAFLVMFVLVTTLFCAVVDELWEVFNP